MKRILTLTAFFCLFLLIAEASDRKFTFGMQFSNGLSFMNSDNVEIDPTNVGYAFDYGLFMNYNFTENYSFGSGFIVDHIRAGRTNSPTLVNNFNAGNSYLLDNDYTPGSKESLKYTYVSIPLTFKLTSNEVGYFKYFGEIGLVNSIRVRSRLNIEGTNIQNENINKRDNLGDYRSGLYNASLVVGGGFQYSLGANMSLLVRLSFQNGFINVVSDGDDERTVLRIVKLTTGIIF